MIVLSHDACLLAFLLTRHAILSLRYERFRDDPRERLFHQVINTQLLLTSSASLSFPGLLLTGGTENRAALGPNRVT